MKFSTLASGLKASEIREILKLTTQPEIISFAGGLPAPEFFPIEELKKVDAEILEKEGMQAVQYGTTEGYLPLREKIAEHMKTAFGVDCSAEELMITSGSQQGLSLLSQIFLDPDDVVLVESPTYLGAINAFTLQHPRFIEVPTDEQGIIPEALEKILQEHGKAVRLMYVIPEFQNPTGITWTEERRKAFMKVVGAYDFPIIEDDPYGELRYDGEKMKALKSLDTKGQLIFLGSFSKIFMPGLRLAWMAASPEILDKAVKLKQAVDLQSSSFAQRQAYYYMKRYDINEHVRNLVQVYGKRRTLMCETMKQYFPQGVTFTYPEGGLFTWVTLPEGMDATALMPKVLAEKVAYVPGGPFYPHGGHRNHFRLNYSNMPEDRIVEGVKRLAAVLTEEMKNIK
ncbi:PLP-dependent aminotransferase family protein [Megasphaera lornae]|uniref:Aminotransferase, class I/II n=1 Tax=Megasphaera lornae TaxID=1000568 RepID=A0ABN0D2R1_9FIRM|nr:PLP-dependent aminotransferase family protein [Megasphaera lornae]EGL42351.1 aminotransferase, class I/II [Megasphaera lornae]KXB92443.1 aminotransferase, class I/II [Veillonellaceae bacterium DNF00751]MUP50278.1 PLP-dependent aminotransferase family protein [Veillonellaceae bacterium M1-70]